MRADLCCLDAPSKLTIAELSNEAVIEILIALLGVMIAVLTLIAGLISFAAAALAFYGYAEIKKSVERIAHETAGKTAEDIATEVATSIATLIGEKASQSILAAAQSNALTEGEAEELIESRPTESKGRGKQKAVSDENLRKPS